VVCVIGVLRSRTSWSVDWWFSDLYDMCSRFLCRSPVHETQHVHDSRMVMVRWFFAGKFSGVSSGATACTDCDAGKYSADSGASTCSGFVCAAGTYGALGSTSSEAASCTSCDAGKYSATAGVESVCVVCVCVFSTTKKAGYIHTLSHTIQT